MPLRIIFMGTPDFSVPSLIELVGQGHEIVGVYSQPPRPAGRRGLELKQSPVHQKAEQFGLPVFTPGTLRDEAEQEAFKNLDADVAIVIAYGLLLPEAVLNAPEYGCYNGHASLLPRWRGAAPIQRAIMAGDTETGSMIMKMDKGLDTGPVALAEKIAIPDNMTAGELHDKLSIVTADLMVRAVGAIERGSLNLTPQADTSIEYAHKIEKSETRIDWSRPATEVHNHIRGLSPFPGSWCEMELSGKTTRVKVLSSEVSTVQGEAGTLIDAGELTIACAENAVVFKRVQKAGGKPQSGEEFLRGNKIDRVI